VRRAAFAGLLLAGACSLAPAAADEPLVLEPIPDPPIVQAETPPVPVVGLGEASWYGLRFHGRRTASGERFDMNALTAAHPHLPFGTVVKVESLLNGRAVTVRINDRGPHTGGRIIDLSHAAARAIGLLGRGTKSVVLTLVREGERRD
jgi:rare lipoprotein A